MKSKSIKSWFFIVLLITVIAYLSIKPETFKSFKSVEGLDISNSYISKTDISNIIYTYDTYDTEDDDTAKEKKKEKTESSYSPYIQEQIAKNLFDKYTTADFAFIFVVFILLFIVLFLLSKLTKI